MKGKIGTKLFVQMAVSVIAFGLFVALAGQLFLTWAQINRAKGLLTDICQSIANKINGERLDIDQEIASRENVFSETALLYNVQVLLISGGVIEFDTREGAQFRTIEGSNETAEGGVFYTKMMESDRGNAPYLCFEKEYVFESVRYTLEVRTYLAAIDESARTSRVFNWYIIIGGIVISCLWVGWRTQSVTKPLVDMNKTAMELAKLNFDSRVEITTSDELGQLGVSINVMSNKLKETIEELTRKNLQLASELEKERELDIMRQKFVSDVSHELKTPIAIIQGYAEALKGAIAKSPERGDKYADIIMEETAKMTKLVYDLLDLSQFQSGRYHIRKTDFEIDVLMKSIVEKYSKMTTQKGVTVELDTESAVVEADPDRIEQVINNLLSNALSHIDNEKILKICGKIENDKYLITVTNSGAPVPEPDIKHIFETFYRADASRDRSEGRFGIGLSIVKALLELHKSNFGVRNVENGVEFYFDLDLFTASK